MLRPLGRSLTDDPLGAYRAARADVEALLDDPEVALAEHDTPMGRVTMEVHIDQVVSTDPVLHGWDLARATGQDDTIDPDEVAQMLPGSEQMGDEMRPPGHFGPGIVVFGPLVKVPFDAPPQDRFLGLIGRDPSA